VLSRERFTRLFLALCTARSIPGVYLLLFGADTRFTLLVGWVFLVLGLSIRDKRRRRAEQLSLPESDGADSQPEVGKDVVNPSEPKLLLRRDTKDT